MSRIARKPVLPQKCARSSPTLQTPHRRIPIRQLYQYGNGLLLRVLSDNFCNRLSHRPKAKEKWTDAELRALTDFVLFHWDGNAWPAHKHEDFSC